MSSIYETDPRLSIHQGDPFSGYLTFDDSAAPGVVHPEETGYAFLEPEFTMYTSLGDLETEPTTFDSPVFGSVVGDGYELWVYGPPGVVSGVSAAGFFHLASGSLLAPGDVASFQLDLYGPTSSTALSDVSFALSSFTDAHATWTIEWADGATSEVSGLIDTRSLIATPEPDSLALIALAAVGLALRGFRRARS